MNTYDVASFFLGVLYFFFLDILTIDGLVELDFEERFDRRSSGNLGLYGMMDCNNTVQH